MLTQRPPEIMQVSAESFDDLLARVRNGDSAAAERLILHYEPQVRAVARVRLGAPLRPYLDSMDVVQSVHRTLLAGLRSDKFDISGPEHLIALVAMLVQRKVARHWNRVKRQRRDSVVRDTSQELFQRFSSIGSGDNDPASRAEYEDSLRRVLESLDETECALIRLRIEGYGTAEAARELGLDPDVSRVRLSRLRKRLRANGVDADI